MKYLEKAAKMIADARTDEKLDKQYDAIEYIVSEFPTAKRIYDHYDKDADMEEKKEVLMDTMNALDDTIDLIKGGIEDEFDCITDALDEEEMQNAILAERKHAHDMGGITWHELREHFYDVNNKNLKPEQAILVFKDDSYATLGLPEEERSYVISSDNKAFQSGKGGYSLFGSPLNHPDKICRLDEPMRYHDPEYRWTVEYCKLKA